MKNLRLAKAAFILVLLSMIVMWSILIYLNYATAIVIHRNDDLRLDLVQVVFRHGDRSPKLIETYPTETEEGSSIYELYGYGQLTQKGKQREYRLGQMLREVYGSFLGNYKAGDVMALSTNSDRTSTSLQLVLAGLYPPKNETIWNPDMMWMPIPIYTVLEEIGAIFNLKFCSKYVAAFKESYGILGNPAMEKDRDFIQFIENRTGLHIERMKQLSNLWYLFEAKNSLGEDFPKWCNEECRGKLIEFTKLYYVISSRTPMMKRYRGGTLLKHFLDNVQTNVSAQGEKRKMYLFAAHDTDIAGFVKALDLPNHKLPQYGSAVVLEKYVNSRDNKVFLKLGVFNDDGIEYYRSTKLSSCSTLCPFDHFHSIMKEFLPTKEELQCRPRELTDKDIERITTIDGQKQQT